MRGTDPQRFMLDMTDKLDSLQDKAEIEGLLDDLELLMTILDPEQQEPADDLANGLKDKPEPRR